MYVGLGTSDKSFNISDFSGDLEFAEDGWMDWIDITALDKNAALKYSPQMAGANLLTFANWLNDMPGWETP